MSLRQKTKLGVLWVAAERFAYQGISFAVQILLARLMPPEEFGIVAAVAIVLAISNVFVDSGFGQALVQKKEVTRDDISSVFYFNMAIAIAIAGLLSMASPAFASFFREPQLRSVLPVLSLTLILGAFGQCQQYMLTRRMQFSLLFRISLPSLIAGAVVGIVMAVSGWKVWSLVGMQLVNRGMSSGLIWIQGDRDSRPGFQFSFQSLKSMAVFGTGVLGERLLHSIFSNIYGLFIGRLFSMGDLAFYNRANTFQKIPSVTAARTINRVLFPAISSIQEDKSRIQRAVRECVTTVTFVIMPMMTFLILAADTVVVTLLTETWRPSVAYLRWLPIVGMCYPVSGINLTVVRALGHSTLILLVNLAKNSLVLMVLWITYRYGITAMIMGQVAIAVVNALINLWFTHHFSGYGVARQLRDILPYLLASMIAGIPVTLLAAAPWKIGPVLLAIQITIYSSTYLLICYFSNLPAMRKVTGYVSRGLADRSSEVTRNA